MESQIEVLFSGLLGVFTGALIQYYFGRELSKHQIELNARSELYLNLFQQLRNLENDTITIHNLICEAQVYASDDVLDILDKIKPGQGFEDMLLLDLLQAIRKELRPSSSARKLNIFVYDKSR